MANIFDEAKNKTRVLVFSTHSSIAKLLHEVLHFYDKDFGFYLENGDFENPSSDFAILETGDIEKATLFQPTIVLITSEIPGEAIIPLLSKITAGGVLIYHSSLSEAVEKSENFFRKLAFDHPQFQKSAAGFVLETNIGAIPISSSDEDLLKNIEGAKLLSQQFGVMEEEFYEPLMSFI